MSSLFWKTWKENQTKRQESCIFTMEMVFMLLLFFHYGDIYQTRGSAAEAKIIALTFDDGPHPIYTERLLDGLKERGVHATFFLLGSSAQQHPELVKRIWEEGHLIGNHTYTHLQLTEKNAEQFEKELLQTAQLLTSITGQQVQYVRPPYGTWNKGYEEKWNMLPVLWNIDPRDWQCKSADVVAKRVISKAQDHGIILLHDEYESSVLASFRIIDSLRQQGYQFVTVDDILFD